MPLIAKRRRVGRVLLLLLLAGMVTLVLLEIGVRAIDLGGGGGVRPDPRCDFILDLSHVPEAKTIYPEATVPHLPDTVRILMLGDSFTHRLYSRGYINHIERRVSAALGRGVEIYCTACPGYGMTQYLKYLRAFADRIDPDLVVLNVFVENDLYESHPSRSYDIIFGMLTPTSCVRSKAVSLLRKSRLLRMCEVLYRIRATGASTWGRESECPLPPRMAFETSPILYDDYAKLTPDARVAFQEGRPVVDAPYMPDELYFLLSRRHMETFSRSLDGYMQEGYRAGLANLEALCRMLGDDGRECLVFLFPSRFQIDPRLRDEAFRSLGVSSGRYDFEQVNRDLERVCRDHGAEVIDLSPPLEYLARRMPLYVNRDIHWNKRGNLAASGEIEEHLLRRLRP